ncbi:MAG TPA: flavodoxin [bacterium]|nr:flavodoxin [bacterium]HNS48927.1 flavodoxin [bacterium]
MEAGLRVLVVYYSWTGNTRRVAEAIARQAGAEIREIVEKQPRRGVRGWLSGARDAARKRPSEIEPPPEGNYDLVIVGTPVWAFTMVPAVRAFLVQSRPRLRDLAFFCTQGSSGAEAAFREMEALGGRPPLGTLTVNVPELKDAEWEARVRKFVEEIECNLRLKPGREIERPEGE